MTMDLERAIDLVRSGDREAFETVVGLTQRRLRVFLSFIAPDRELVDEVAQQAYITVYEKIHEYQVETNFLAWLKMIANNHLRNELRRRQRGNGASERLSLVLAPTPEPDQFAEYSDRLQQCLGTLGENSRQLLEWRYQEGLSPAEIALKTQRIASSVRVTLTRVRQLLLECLRQHA